MYRHVKQIEEMLHTLHEGIKPFKATYGTDEIVSILYDAGYRKQVEGKWKLLSSGSGTCSECGFTQKNVWDNDAWQNYCGHCGAKMSI